MNEQIILSQLQAHHQITLAVMQSLVGDIAAASESVCRTLASGGKLLLLGNGGSAAQAQHLAAELTGRFQRQRPGLPAVALTSDSAGLTAIGNDFGFDQVFARQIEALARPGDLVIALSTSGNSPNVVEGLKRAGAIPCSTLLLSGTGGGKARRFAQQCLLIPAEDPARIQELHLVVGHLICQIAEQQVSRPADVPRLRVA